MSVSVIVGGSLLACALVGWSLYAARRNRGARARAEQAAHEAAAQLERFFSLSLDFLCIASDDGYFKRVSPGVTEMLGWSPQEFLARPYLEFIHPDDHERTLREVEKQIRGGERVLQFENRYRHKNGTWRTLSWRSMPQPNGFMYATARDVTDHKLAADALHEANDRLEQRVQERTAELERVARSLAAEVREREQAQLRLQSQLQRLNLLQHITRAIGDRQDIRSIFQAVVGTVEEEMPVDFCCVGLYDATDECLTITSVGTRSTTLAMALAMAEQARIPIDRNGLSRCLRGELVHEPDVMEVPFPFAQRLAHGALRSFVAAPLLVASKPFAALLVARRQAHSFTSGDCEFLRQLSEHVALAAHQAELHGALQRAYDELRETQKHIMQQERLRALGQMASGIAHDINNAISPAAIYTEMLLERERSLSPSVRERLASVLRAIHDVAQTVARLREFYRPREPQKLLVPVDLNRLVPEVVDLTRARWGDIAQQRGIAVAVQSDLAPDLPAILGAESEIREALTNLVLNAVDAMPQGGPLTLRTRFAPQDAGGSAAPLSQVRVCLEVIDSGLGMSEETRRRCFEPFFTTKGERGTGLGLAMVYGIAQRHGADIEIESEVGRGTTVRLIFTVPKVSAAELATPAAGDRAVRPRRILIVDDDPLVLKILREALASDGHDVTAADGGQAGIDTFLAAHRRGEPFPVVITDLGMPHVDGRKVSAAVKTSVPTTTVIMLTGWGQRLVADGDTPLHVDFVLGKPPKLRELREALEQTPEPTGV